MINCVFGKNRQFIGLNHFGDSVIDFRVNVIRSANQKYSMLARLLDSLNNLLTVIADIAAIVFKLICRSFDGTGNLSLADTFSFKFFSKAINELFLIVDRQEWLHEFNITLADYIHISADILSIRGDNWTVVIIVGASIEVIRLARIEDSFNTTFD